MFLPAGDGVRIYATPEIRFGARDISPNHLHMAKRPMSCLRPGHPMSTKSAELERAACNRSKVVGHAEM